MRAPRIEKYRRKAEALMIDTCVVHRPDLTQVIDELTGERPMIQVYPDPSWPTDHPHANGKAKSQSYQPHEQIAVAGGHAHTVQRYQVHFPVCEYKPTPGDVITWLTCKKSPNRVGTQERIEGPLEKTLETAQRVYTDRTTA